MDKKALFLFPGQGAQSPGMAIDLYEESAEVRDLFELASDVLKQDMYQLLSESTPDYLKRSDISQIAITLASLSAVRYLKSKGISPAACGGFSLGEYPAMCASGVLTEAETLELVNYRGKIMQSCCEFLASNGNPPGMTAVLGLPPEKVNEILSKNKIENLYGANYNSSKQTVLSGTAESLEKGEEVFKAEGARRVVRLAVAGPFHSPLMSKAAEEFLPVIEKTSFKEPAVPLFSNVTGKQVKSLSELKENACKHLTHPVLWTLEESEFQKLQPEMVLEVGPGKVLSGLWADTGYPVPCQLAGTLQDINNL